VLPVIMMIDKEDCGLSILQMRVNFACYYRIGILRQLCDSRHTQTHSQNDTVYLLLTKFRSFRPSLGHSYTKFKKRVVTCNVRSFQILLGIPYTSMSKSVNNLEFCCM
jgi:hypothetical protein